MRADDASKLDPTSSAMHSLHTSESGPRGRIQHSAEVHGSVAHMTASASVSEGPTRAMGRSAGRARGSACAVGQVKEWHVGGAAPGSAPVQQSETPHVSVAHVILPGLAFRRLVWPVQSNPTHVVGCATGPVTGGGGDGGVGVGGGEEIAPPAGGGGGVTTTPGQPTQSGAEPAGGQTVPVPDASVIVVHVRVAPTSQASVHGVHDPEQLTSPSCAQPLTV